MGGSVCCSKWSSLRWPCPQASPDFAHSRHGRRRGSRQRRLRRRRPLTSSPSCGASLHRRRARWQPPRRCDPTPMTSDRSRQAAATSATSPARPQICEFSTTRRATIVTGAGKYRSVDGMCHLRRHSTSLKSQNQLRSLWTAGAAGCQGGAVWGAIARVEAGGGARGGATAAGRGARAGKGAGTLPAPAE